MNPFQQEKLPTGHEPEKDAVRQGFGLGKAPPNGKLFFIKPLRTA
jgi:hypothetical protein